MPPLANGDGKSGGLEGHGALFAGLLETPDQHPRKGLLGEAGLEVVLAWHGVCVSLGLSEVKRPGGRERRRDRSGLPSAPHSPCEQRPNNEGSANQPVHATTFSRGLRFILLG